MQLKYGSYTHSDSEAAVSIRREPLRNAGDVVYAYRHTWNVSGKVFGADQAAVKAAIDGLVLAYAFQGQDLVLLHNDGSISSHVLTSGDSLGGVRVTSGPSFPVGDGAEYTTWRTYEITLEAEYPAATTNLLDFHETVEFSGGGNLWAHVPLVNGLPQKQLLYADTAFRATQSGIAVGYLLYPNPPAPLWPGDFKQAPTIRRTSPKRTAGGYREFVVEWAYEFEAILPMIGGPTLWP